MGYAFSSILTKVRMTTACLVLNEISMIWVNFASYQTIGNWFKQRIYKNIPVKPKEKIILLLRFHPLPGKATLSTCRDWLSLNWEVINKEICWVLPGNVEKWNRVMILWRTLSLADHTCCSRRSVCGLSEWRRSGRSVAGGWFPRRCRWWWRCIAVDPYKLNNFIPELVRLPFPVSTSAGSLSGRPGRLPARPVRWSRRRWRVPIARSATPPWWR